MKKKLLLVIGLCIGITATACSSNSTKTDEAVQTEQTNTVDETEEDSETEEIRPDYLLADLPFDGEECTVPDTVASPEKYT